LQAVLPSSAEKLAAGMRNEVCQKDLRDIAARQSSHIAHARRLWVGRAVASVIALGAGHI
jgi:hypothetical protein